MTAIASPEAAQMTRWRAGIDDMLRRRATRDPATSARYERLAEEILPTFGLRGRVLDIGCGEGWMRRVLTEATGYVGVDSIYPGQQVFRFPFARADAEHLPFRNRSFDGVLCYSVLQHVIHPDRVVAEAARVLKPSGRAGWLVCTDANPIFLHCFTERQLGALVRARFRIVRQELRAGSLWIATTTPSVDLHAAQGKAIPLRIAYLTHMFPAWSETFERRVIEGLRDAGHTVCVFSAREPVGPPAPGCPGVEVILGDDARIRGFRPDVLLGGMGFKSQRRAFEVAQALDVPFALRVWSGLDAFVSPSADFYRAASRDPRCLAILVEDGYMAAYAERAMAVDPGRLGIVPNSFDVRRFSECRRTRVSSNVLAIGRFTPKKGFAALVKAMRHVPWLSLRLVGAGPEESALRAIAAPNVDFAGTVAERCLPELYAEAGMLVAPCTLGPKGDADGIPTTVLEAMASGCPVITSDLHAASEYVIHGENGLLTPPDDEFALAGAMHLLATNRTLARSLGEKAQAFAAEHLDIGQNVKLYEAALRGALCASSSR